jgi:dTDP-4-dehydrorhamnose reductase
LINAKAVEVFAQEAKKVGALLIHYSTDYVFDGTKNTPYLEDDLPNPLNVYGESKLAGEQAIQASGADYLIFRTTWVFASRGQNFVKSILRLAAERDELNIVADQIGAPTSARFIADATAHILRQAQYERDAKTFISGIFNLTNSDETSWFGFAEKIVKLARWQNTEFKNRLINPIPTSAYPTPAKRPANSRLSTAKLQQRFGLNIPTWEQSITLCLEEIYGK